MKGTFHKSCSCWMCRRGRATKAGQFTKKANERKFRHAAKVQLRARAPEDVDIHPISSPYTD